MEHLWVNVPEVAVMVRETMPRSPLTVGCVLPLLHEGCSRTRAKSTERLSRPSNRLVFFPPPQRRPLLPRTHPQQSHPWNHQPEGVKRPEPSR